MIHIYTQSGVWRCRPRDGAGMQGDGSGGSDGSVELAQKQNCLTLLE